MSDDSKNRISYIAEDKILEHSQHESFPYVLNICGKAFKVFEQVFSPKYFPDVDFFADNLPIAAGSEFLEVGTGIGFTAIMAAFRGASRVVAADINPHAVENTLENVKWHGLQDIVEVRLGSVFDSIPASEKFDVIYWNAPFQFIEAGIARNMLQLATGDSAYQGLAEYLTNGARHLKANGRLFLGFSSSIGRMDKLQEILQQIPCAILRVAAKKIVSRDNNPVAFELFEVVYDFK
jgi:methylase of polypeptide subunit release factors